VGNHFQIDICSFSAQRPTLIGLLPSTPQTELEGFGMAYVPMNRTRAQIDPRTTPRRVCGNRRGICSTRIVSGCILFDLGIGNLLTLPPLIAQGEFPSGSVPRVMALVTAINQSVFAFAPAVLGVLREVSGGYQIPYLTAAVVQVIAAAVILLRRGLAPAGQSHGTDGRCAHCGVAGSLFNPPHYRALPCCRDLHPFPVSSPDCPLKPCTHEPAFKVPRRVR